MVMHTVHFYGALAAIGAALVLGLLWRAGRLPTVSRPVAALVGLGLLALGLLGNGRQGATGHRLFGSLYPVLMTPAGAAAAETAAGWMLEQAFLDVVAAQADRQHGCTAEVRADALRARVTAGQWRYRDAHDRFGITISPPPPDGTPLVVLAYVDVQNWFFSLFDGGVDRRQFCLSDLSRYETALQIVALLSTATDAAVQEQALTLLGAEPVGEIGAWLAPRLGALTGKMSSPKAEAALAAQRARAAPNAR